MSAHIYSVVLDPSVNTPTRNGVKSAIVVAESSTDAKKLLESLHGDVASWANATVTEMAAGTDLEGWTLHLEVIDTDGSTTLSVDVVGVADDTFDLVGAAAVTALNALSNIAHAAYSSNVLTVAGTADGFGDQRLVAAFYPPNEELVAVPGFLGSVVDGGSSGDALTVAFAADAYTIPNLNAKYKPSQEE